MKNVIYFKDINSVGGVETFLYQIAKKYRDRDITVYYTTADFEQLRRLRKYVRAKQWDGTEEIICDKVFLNYQMEPFISHTKAKEYIAVIHADYDHIPYKPILHPKITKYVAVSDVAAKAFTRNTGIKCECFYPPVVIGNEKKTTILLSAGRFHDGMKGKERMAKLAQALEETNAPYMWLVFSDHGYESIASGKNMIVFPPNLNMTPFFKLADWVVNLSDSESFCYTVNEALSVGTPVVTTPCPVYTELGIDKQALILDYDCKNVKDVARRIVSEKPKINYTAPADGWASLLVDGKTTYDPEKEDRYTVEDIVPFFDMHANREREVGDRWDVDTIRLNELIGDNEWRIAYVKRV